jgi:hypothetical protein
LRANIEQGRGTLPDTHLELAVCGSKFHRAVHHFADPDRAVCCFGGDSPECPVDRDVAVGGIASEVAFDLADPSGAVQVFDHRRTIDFADAHLPGASDLSAAPHTVDAHCPRRRAHAQRASFVQSQISGAGGERALSKPAGASEVTKRNVTFNA